MRNSRIPSYDEFLNEQNEHLTNVNEAINNSGNRSYQLFNTIAKGMKTQIIDVEIVKDDISKVIFSNDTVFLIKSSGDFGEVIGYNKDNSDTYYKIPSRINSFKDLVKSDKLLSMFKTSTFDIDDIIKSVEKTTKDVVPVQTDNVDESLRDLSKFLSSQLPYLNYTIETDHIVIEGTLDLSNKNLVALPNSFGNLKIKGSLYLYNNNLKSLPETFGNLKVDGDLHLYNNNLKSLPETFGNLKVGGDLRLGYNKLKSLPESFGNLKINGSLNLTYNNLKSLPETFGNLKINGILNLNNNNLKSLPDSFGNLEIGGDLYIKYNNLTSLPDSFKDLNIGGKLYLDDMLK